MVGFLSCPQNFVLTVLDYIAINAHQSFFVSFLGYKVQDISDEQNKKDKCISCTLNYHLLLEVNKIQFFSLEFLLMDSSLLNILFGLVGRARKALNLELLPRPSDCRSLSSNSSSAIFIFSDETLDLGDLKPETLH